MKPTWERSPARGSLDEFPPSVTLLRVLTRGFGVSRVAGCCFSNMEILSCAEKSSGASGRLLGDGGNLLLRLRPPSASSCAASLPPGTLPMDFCRISFAERGSV